MKNPLRKRIPREFRSDFGKYVVILVFMIVMIGAASGVYVANDSMEKSISDAKETYILEDGRFELEKRLMPNS